MKFELPGFKDTNVRLFERVDTVDPQYQVFDCGIEHSDGGIDSLVVPGSGSFHSISKMIDEDKVKELAEVRIERRRLMDELEARLKAEADKAAVNNTEEDAPSEDEAVGATA